MWSVAAKRHGFRRASRERLRWAVRIRAAVIVLFLAVALAARSAGLFPSLGPALAAAAAGTLMNLAAAARVRRWRGIPAMIAWTGAGDALIITYVVWATGGTASPFLFLYAVQAVTTALVVDLPTAALASTAGLALLAIVVLGPAALAGGLARGGSEATGAGERLIWLFSLGLTLLLLTFIGGYLTRRLARTERELAGAHWRLGRSMRRLARAHAALQGAYARLARAEAQLVAAEKMRALGVLVAGVAHELGNPLTVLAGNLEPLADAIVCYERMVAAFETRTSGARLLLSDHAELRRDIPALLANCREATGRAVALLAQLRSFGRGSPASARYLTPLRPGLESTLALVRHRLPPGVRVCESYDAAPEVLCAPAELNQVFMNLLLNAADALRPGGTLWITLGQQDGEVQVTIRDDGAGIAPGDLPHLFEPFFTTKEVGQGSGLGLAISHAIVARHGGRIEAHAPAGEGAAFVVHLPLACSSPEIGRRPYVEAIAQAISEEVQAEDGHHDGEPREDREMGRHQDEGPAVVQHRAPGRGGRLRAEAEEAERGLGDDRARHAEGGLHEERRGEQRQQVAQQNAAIGYAEGVGRLDELALAQAPDLAACQACVARPTDQAEGEDDVPEARSEDAGERDREQEAGEGEKHVDRPHEEIVHPAARIARRRADGTADDE